MSQNKLTIALFASVALNLFVIGAVVGGLVVASREPEAPVEPAARPGPALWAAGSQLPPETRREFRRMLREEGAQGGQRLREARQARRAAWETMAKEPFDEAATNQALDQARLLEMNARRDVEHRIVRFAGRLPADERARFAAALSPASRDGEQSERRRRRPDRHDEAPEG